LAVRREIKNKVVMNYKKQFYKLMSLALDLGLKIESSDNKTKVEEIFTSSTYQRLSKFLMDYKPVLEAGEEVFEEERYLNLI
jgi:hypothetical protein